jgi:photosystem II stability/assembly factor-like uncharacterized protein
MIEVSSPRTFTMLLCGALLLACPDAERAEMPMEPPVWPGLDLVAVDVIDDEQVIVVARTGEIHRSGDAGLSWQTARTPAVAGLRSISMADTEVGWTVGHGVILRTDDGGLSWRRQRLPGQANQMRLVSVGAIDRERALAVGRNGVRLRTLDGGRVWQDVSQNSDVAFESSSLLAGVFCGRGSNARCWSVGGAIRTTSDVGRTWRRMDVEDLVSIEPIGFAFGQVEVAESEAERFENFISSNRHRTQSEWQIEPGVSQGELEQIGRRRDPDAFFELIAARIQEVRSLLEEGGVQPDRVVVFGAPPWDYEDYLDDDPHFLERYWTERGALESSVRVRIVDSPNLISLRVAAHGIGFAVGEEGALLRSEDAGEHWKIGERVSPHDLHGVGIGRRRAVAVGKQGGIWLSEDQGRTWLVWDQSQQAPFFDNLLAVSFAPTGEVGMIVGEHGRILRSLNGGAEWESLCRDGA